jgi:hypothetical protein
MKEEKEGNPTIKRVNPWLKKRSVWSPESNSPVK